jgi:hypothetical protein
MRYLTVILLFLSVVCMGQQRTYTGTKQYTGDYIIFDIDSVDTPGAIAQFHRIDSIDVSVADAWVTVKWDSLIALESTYGYKFNSDSTGIVCTRSCDTRVQGCGHWIWRGAGGTSVKLYIRVLIDGVEARCLQANDTRTNGTGDDGTMPYTGTIHHDAGEVVNVQYRVTNVDMDFEGDAVFDNPVSFSVNFECINHH